MQPVAWEIPTSDWWLAVLALVWVGVAAHTGWWMRRYNRRWWVWFLISLCATPVPAAIVSCWEYFRQLRRRRQGPPPARCPHCGSELTGGDVRRVGGHSICPDCNMVLDDQDYG